MTSSHHDERRRDLPIYRSSHRIQHSLGYRTEHPARKIIALCIIATLCLISSIVAAVWLDFSAAIRSRAINVIASKTMKNNGTSVDPHAHQPINMLLLGQDTREGANRAFGGGGETENHQSDTAMVVQISADRSYINIVSIPRDSMVDFSGCQTSKGRIPAQKYTMFNSIFARGYNQGGDLASAASCTLQAVNDLTGLSIAHFIVADFSGLSNMINAIGGVSLCIPQDTSDAYTGARFKRGLQHLDGVQATQYARMRHDIASDGSDIMRTTRQQYLVKQLITQTLSKNLLTQSAQLYQLAKSALNSLSISNDLANPGILASLAMSLRNLHASHIYARTVPIMPDPMDANRVVWSPQADDLWQTLRMHKPLTTMASHSKHDPASQVAQDHSSSPQDSEQSNTNDTNQTDTSNHPSNKTHAQLNNKKKINPKTGLYTDAQGQLIDPTTGGIVNPENGTIRDPITGSYVGFADRYINATVCQVPTKQ